MTCVEPGFVETELQGHNENPIVVENIEKMREQIGEPLTAEDIANAVIYAVSQAGSGGGKRDPRSAEAPGAMRRRRPPPPRLAEAPSAIGASAIGGLWLGLWGLQAIQMYVITYSA